MRNLGLYWEFIIIYMKSKLEYRIGFFAEMLANFVLVGVYYAGIIIIFNKFDNINGWDLNQILVLFSFNWLCYSMSGFLFWAPMLGLGDIVQSGEFDSYLIRPMSPLLYLVFKQFQYTFLPRLIVAVIFIIKSFAKCGITVTVNNIFLILLYLVCGIVIHSCILICVGASSFLIIQNRQVGEVLTNSDYGLRTFVDYPLSIYNKFIRFILIFIVPYAFVNYFPMVTLLGKTSENPFGPVTLIMPIIVASIMCVIARVCWIKGMRKYESTGN